MGAAAAERRRDNGQASPRIRLLPGTERGHAATAARSASRARAQHSAACRRGFHIACAIIVVACAMGMMRVELSVRAAETALATNALRDDIAAEQLRNHSLESRRLALEAPGRIESIAGVSMGMSVAENVTFIDVPAPRPAATVADSGRVDYGGEGRDDPLGSMFTNVIRVTAGTAQLLLASDAGSASSR